MKHDLPTTSSALTVGDLDAQIVRRYLAVAAPVAGSAVVAPSPAVWAVAWAVLGSGYAAARWMRERRLDRLAAETPIPAVRAVPDPAPAAPDLVSAGAA